jgi:hypothetical protein
MNSSDEKLRTLLGLRVVCLVLLGGLVVFGVASGARAQGSPTSGAVTVEISRESAALTAGEWVEFNTVLRNNNTVLRNNGAIATPPMTAHLSIAALAAGKHVDPEDWSPQRTQFLSPLQPGESVQLPWRLHVLFEGAFASFVTLVSENESFAPVVSPSLRVQVAQDSILPWKDVIPVVAVVPLFPLALLVITVAYARRR